MTRTMGNHRAALTQTNLETDRKREIKKLGDIFGIFGTKVEQERSTNKDEDAAAAAADDQGFNDYGHQMDAGFFGGVDDGDVDLELGAVDCGCRWCGTANGC